MEMHEIYYLDCSKKENRIKLVKEIMKKMKLDTKPTLDQLDSFVRRIEKKYKVHIVLIKYMPHNKMMMSITQDDRSYAVIECSSLYECSCKFILYAAKIIEYKRIRK